MNIEEGIKYSINKLENIMEKSLTKTITEFDEYYLFNNNDNIISIEKKYHRFMIRYEFQTLMLNQMKNIKFVKKSSEALIDDCISPYGSFYYGGDTFYYSDKIHQYNEEQLFQILCNHIFHYLYAYNIYLRNSDSIKSNILLAFSHMGLTKTKVRYAQTNRNKICKSARYSHLMEQLIIFEPSSNYMKFFARNVFDGDTFIRYKYCNKDKTHEMIIGGEMHITENYNGFNIYNYIIENGRVKKSYNDKSEINNIISDNIGYIVYRDFENADLNNVRNNYYEIKKKISEVSKNEKNKKLYKIW